MIVILILCAVVLSLFMSVVTIYIDAQTDINQAKENAQPHTYHIASVAKSANETFINTVEGVQFVIDPGDTEWLEYKDGEQFPSPMVTTNLIKLEMLYTHTPSQTKPSRMDTSKRRHKRNKSIGTPIKSRLIRKEIQWTSKY